MSKRKTGFIHRVKRRWVQAKWTATIVGTLLLANFIIQVVRKPTEALGLAFTSKKSVNRTWEAYKDEFLISATPLITPEFLAAIAQTESAGDPVAQPPWVFRWTTDIMNIYSPASSAVGLMQITEGNFKEAKKLCVRDGKVSHDCWWNGLYARIFPSHSIELASAYMHQTVEQLLGSRRAASMDRDNVHKVAAIVHLCGKQKASEYVSAGMKLRTFSRCGNHEVVTYLRTVFTYRAQFARLVGSSELAGARDERSL